MAQCPVIAILRGIADDEVAAVCDALYTAGIRIIEIPLNYSGASKSLAAQWNIAKIKAIPTEFPIFISCILNEIWYIMLKISVYNT